MKATGWRRLERGLGVIVQTEQNALVVLRQEGRQRRMTGRWGMLMSFVLSLQSSVSGCFSKGKVRCTLLVTSILLVGETHPLLTQNRTKAVNFEFAGPLHPHLSHSVYTGNE